MNPVAIQKYPWTSLNGFLKIKTRPKFMDCRWMSYAEGLSDTPNGWRRYANLLAMRNSDNPKEIESLDRRMCRGWCIGAEEFRKTVSEDFLELETSATNAWLGQQPNMGAPRSVSAICGRYAKQRNAECPYYLKLSNLTIDY
jgi:hypothetical protein